MTALAGFWAFGPRLASRRNCQAMLAAQARYGCSTPSVAEHDALALGLSLKSMLPEDEFDRQPLIGCGGRIRLIADVRLDNRLELAEALGIDAAAATGLADSEFLLRAIERWGEAAPERIVGDFAFAWFDAESRRLRLVRDQVGTRPLFWHRGSDFFAFASMPSGLHAVRSVPRAPDLDSLARFAALLPPGGEESYWRHIHRVEPGRLVEVSSEGHRSRRWWQPQRRILSLPRFEDYVEAFRAQIDQAVECRLRGARGVAASHLSSGWDSSAVTATAARLLAQSGGRVVAFTAVPAHEDMEDRIAGRISNEGPIAATVAAMHPNIEHRLMPSSGTSPIEALDAYFDTFERPMFNLCNHVWLSEIRKAAGAADARVLLSGEIGNWTISLGPYSLLADYLREGRFREWARAAWLLAKERRSRLRGIAARSFGPWIPDFVWRLLTPFGTGGDAVANSALSPGYAASVGRDQAAYYHGATRRPSNIFAAMLRAINEMDYGEYRKGVLAGWGIDKRDPTADRRVIEFVLSLPLEMLFKDGVRRPLARAALADRLPAILLDERQKGYQAADWNLALRRDRENVSGLLEEIECCSAAASVLNVPKLRALVCNWPEGPMRSLRELAPYRFTLLNALSVGHFIVRASRPVPNGGTAQAG